MIWSDEMFKTKKFKELEKQNEFLQNKLKSVSIFPLRVIENVDELIEEECFDTVKYLIRTLTDYLTLKEATHCLIVKNTHSIEKNDDLLTEIFRLTMYSDLKYQTKVCSLNYSISDLNLILNTWNEVRIVSNLTNINKKNILHPCSNIKNFYIYPLDVVICGGGNHSQFSAKLRQEGETHISEIIDISNLYTEITFDGENFIDSNNEIIKSCENEGEKIIGVLYEIGRLLRKNQNIIEKYFDKEIIEEIKNE